MLNERNVGFWNADCGILAWDLVLIL